MNDGRRSARDLVSRDGIAGALFAAAGLAGVVVSRALPVGEAARMGPGFMPLAFSWLLAGLGLLILTRSLLLVRPARGEPSPGAGWWLRPIGAVLASIVLFALTVERLGLVIAVAAVVVTASLASPESRRIEVALLAVGLASFSAILFVKLLGLPIALWPS